MRRICPSPDSALLLTGPVLWLVMVVALPCLPASKELDTMAKDMHGNAEIDPGTYVFPQTCSPCTQALLTGKVVPSPCPLKPSPGDFGIVVNGATRYDMVCCSVSVSLQKSSAFLYFPQLLLHIVWQALISAEGLISDAAASLPSHGTILPTFWTALLSITRGA